MKAILIWVGVGIVSFLLIFAIIFWVLTSSMEPITPESVMVSDSTISGDSTMVYEPEILEIPKSRLDSLIAINDSLTSEIFFKNLSIDSLTTACETKNNLILQFESQTDNLLDRLDGANNTRVNIKELAKTYESMKVNEIKPIIRGIDDNTVIALYKNMGARSRKKIFQALSNERAAKITTALVSNKNK